MYVICPVPNVDLMFVFVGSFKLNVIFSLFHVAEYKKYKERKGQKEVY
jgi:hypothetical protein